MKDESATASVKAKLIHIPSRKSALATKNKHKTPWSAFIVFPSFTKDTIVNKKDDENG